MSDGRFETTTTRPSGEIAAAISYRRCDRPAWLPPDFDATDAEEIEFFVLQALDGASVDAVLRRPKGKLTADGTVVISVHGSGGNFSVSGSGTLVRNLARHGYAVFGVNTRQHDDRVYTENFFDVRYDIEAAVHVVRALGYKRIVLHGQSLGNIQVQFYAAINWDNDIRGVVLTGMFANLPWKSRHLLIGDEEKYQSLAAQSVELLHANSAGALLPTAMPMGKDLPEVPVTAQHFLTYRLDGVSAAEGVFWIKRIPRPVLMIRDEGDMMVHDFEPNVLLAAAQSGDSIVPRIEFVSLPNPKGLNPAGHSFTDNQDKLVATVVEWLARL